MRKIYSVYKFSIPSGIVQFPVLVIPKIQKKNIIELDQ